VVVAGLTQDEAKAALEKHLKQFIKNPSTFVGLAQTRGMQQIQGPHLVRPDGTIGLGIYGSVYITGMTIAEAKAAIEEHLSQYLLKPEMSVDVAAYNSKVYYVITDLAGNGETVIRLPVTGNETVLDAIGNINGLSAVSSKHRIWVARPAPDDAACEQVLPINWKDITKGGATATNYQLLPGDRLYIAAAPLITADTYIARLTAPFERIFGFLLLGNSTIRTLGGQQGGQGLGGGF
jgi:protein involved in polysaccharide export with SLBB domain